MPKSKSAVKSIVKSPKSYSRVMRPSPAASGSITRVTPFRIARLSRSGVDGIVGVGCELITSLVVYSDTVDGDLLYSIALNPNTIGGKLSVEGSIYETFRFLRADVYVSSMVSAITPGSIVLYYDADCADVPLGGAPGIITACAHANNTISSVHTDCKFVIDFDRSQPPRYVDPVSGDPRLANQGTLNILWHGASPTEDMMIGSVFFNYEIEFLNSNLAVKDVVEPGQTVFFPVSKTFALPNNTTSEGVPIYLLNQIAATVPGFDVATIPTHEGPLKAIKVPKGVHFPFRILANLVGSSDLAANSYDWLGSFVGTLDDYAQTQWSGYTNGDWYPHTGVMSNGNWYASTTRHSSDTTDFSYDMSLNILSSIADLYVIPTLYQQAIGTTWNMLYNNASKLTFTNLDFMKLPSIPIGSIAVSGIIDSYPIRKYGLAVPLLSQTVAIEDGCKAACEASVPLVHYQMPPADSARKSSPVAGGHRFGSG